MHERRELDDVDRAILETLLGDSRTPYSEIAEEVDMSPPAVSDRVEKLKEDGVVQRFTVDVDRGMLQGGRQLFVEVEAEPGQATEVYRTLAEASEVDHVFRLVDGRVVAYADVSADDLTRWLAEAVDLDDVMGYDVSVVEEYSWTPGVGDVDFALDCVVCGNEVGGDGVTEEFDGDAKDFCCPSCLARYEEEYRERREKAD